MEFPGVWAAPSGTAAFRVVPKCACSTVGQLLYFSEHGRFYDGDIHSRDAGLLKWEEKDQRVRIAEIVLSQRSITFTCVRNPFTRILSAFFDKVAGRQPDGTPYRGDAILSRLPSYGIDLEEGFDQIASFRRFLRFAADTIRSGSPMEADIHWVPVGRILESLVKNGARYDAVIGTEDLAEDVAGLFAKFDAAKSIEAVEIPRFNEGGRFGPKRAFPVEDYFDPASAALMEEIYAEDFDLFRYGSDPSSTRRDGEIDLEKLNRVLRAK